VNEPPDIDLILSEIVTLPSLPGTIERVLHKLDDPECSLREIGQMISTDPAIALKTLRLVNSAQYGTRNPVTSVENAVTFLGAKVIKNLVLSAAVFDQLNKGTDQFVRHSIVCGIAMEMLVSEKSSLVQIAPDEAFVFGVLHDVGNIVFQEFLSEQWQAALDKAREEDVPLYMAEREIVGLDHAMMGARLAQHWRLPPELVNAIGGHHDVSECSDAAYRPLAALLGVADYICHASGIPGISRPMPAVSPEAWEASGLKSADMPAIVDAFFQALPNVDELVEMAST